MEEKIKALYERYVDACAMCTMTECYKCTLKCVIDDLSEILEQD